MPTPRPRVIVSLRPECPGAFDARPHPSQIVTCIYRYFSFRIAFSPESKFTADRAYIHVCAPHALFPIGGLLWQLSPWKTSRYHGRAGVASAVTHLPLWRQLFYALGCVPAERRVLVFMSSMRFIQIAVQIHALRLAEVAAALGFSELLPAPIAAQCQANQRSL